MIKVSVIIPVYNTEKYLKECLNSVINQSLKDIEIICVNDGSTDNSLKILNAYANKDNRIKILSQENKGQGAARNLALKYTNGKYIYFMDSDDILGHTALEETYNICEEKLLDFIIFKLTSYNENTKKEYKEEYYEMSDVEEFIKDKIFNYNDLGNLIFEIPVSTVNKLFNAKFFKNLNIKFPEGLIFEDNIIFWEALFNAKRICLYNKHLYIRRRHSNSTTGNTNNIHLIDTIKINNLIIEKFIKYNLFETYKKELYNRKINLIFHRFKEINVEYKNLFFNEMKKDFLNMLNDYRFNDIVEHLTYRNRNIFENVIFSQSYKDLNKNIKINNLMVYNTCRIDIKNKGNNNNIKFIENSDNLVIKEPLWFKDKTGIGYTIENNKNSLNLKIKCIGNGEINIILRGPDIRDKNNNRFPVYIDYTNFVINNKNILNKHQLVCHDKPYIYKKNVKNGEIINLYIKWLPFNKNSTYKDEEKIQKEKINKLNNENNKLNNENNKLNNENNKLNNENNKLKEKISKIEKENSKTKEKYNSLKEEHEKILTSNSWKITKPLRNIKNKLKK